MTIIRGPHIASTHPDGDGNHRAINPRHAGFVGYGRTADEAKENLSSEIRTSKRANPLAVLEASFMTLSEEDQARFLADLPKLRRS